MRELTDIDAYVIVIHVDEDELQSEMPSAKGKEIQSVKVGGKEYHKGQTMSPEDAEELFQKLISENPGPLNIHTEDASTGSKVTTRVDNWSDFTGGPRINADIMEQHVIGLQQKGYLLSIKTRVMGWNLEHRTER